MLREMAIYEDPAATLDDLREAVSSEDADCAARMLGGTHPFTERDPSAIATSSSSAAPAKRHPCHQAHHAAILPPPPMPPPAASPSPRGS